MFEKINEYYIIRRKGANFLMQVQDNAPKEKSLP